MERPLVYVTVDQSLEYVGIGRFQYGLVVMGAFLKATEGVEIYILSIIDPLLRCAWSISSFQAASLTVFVFFGMLIGGLIWGSISDSYGRRHTLLITASSVICYGVLSSISPTYLWIVFLRTILGFFLNGLLITTMTYIMEFTPPKYRGKILFILFAFWPIGGILTAAFAYLTVPLFGWRGTLLSSVIPLIFPLVIIYLMPNSPHFLMTAGEVKEAFVVVNKISKINRKVSFPFGLTLTGIKCSSQIKELFSPKLKKTIICLLILYFGQGIVYVGHILVVVLLPMYKHNCLQNMSVVSKAFVINEDVSCCIPLTTQTYYNMIFTSLGEMISIIFTLPLIDVIGRRLTMFINGLLGSIFILFLSLCVSKYISTFLFVISRTFLGGFTMTLLLYTLEVFPTSVRNFGTGVCQIASFVGSIGTPFIAQIMIPNGYGLQVVLLYSCLLFLTVMCVCLLPIETRGRALTDTSAENESNYYDIPLLSSKLSNHSLKKSQFPKQEHLIATASEIEEDIHHYGTLK